MIFNELLKFLLNNKGKSFSLVDKNCPFTAEEFDKIQKITAFKAGNKSYCCIKNDVDTELSLKVLEKIEIKNLAVFKAKLNISSNIYLKDVDISVVDIVKQINEDFVADTGSFLLYYDSNRKMFKYLSSKEVSLDISQISADKFILDLIENKVSDFKVTMDNVSYTDNWGIVTKNFNEKFLSNLKLKIFNSFPAFEQSEEKENIYYCSKDYLNVNTCKVDLTALVKNNYVYELSIKISNLVQTKENFSNVFEKVENLNKGLIVLANYGDEKEFEDFCTHFSEKGLRCKYLTTNGDKYILTNSFNEISQTEFFSTINDVAKNYTNVICYRSIDNYSDLLNINTLIDMNHIVITSVNQCTVQSALLKLYELSTTLLMRNQICNSLELIYSKARCWNFVDKEEYKYDYIQKGEIINRLFYNDDFIPTSSSNKEEINCLVLGESSNETVPIKTELDNLLMYSLGIKDRKWNDCIKGDYRVEDVYLSAGQRVLFRSDTGLNYGRTRDEVYSNKIITPRMTQALAEFLLSEKEMKDLEICKSARFAYSIQGYGRFRVSIHRQRNSWSFVFRLLSGEAMNVDDLGIPQEFQDLALKRTQGLILFTGGTGEGKSTLANSMIKMISENTSKNIISIENPIEILHSHGNGLVQQREIGVDVDSFEKAIDDINRSRADVTFIGEMQTAEIIEQVLRVGGSAGLVMSTFHTNGAVQTIRAILDMCPQSKRNTFKTYLSSTLLGIYTQRRIESENGNVVYVKEIFINDENTRMIIAGEDKDFPKLEEAMRTSKAKGMVTLEQDLARLVSENKLTFNDGLINSRNQDLFKNFIEKYQSIS